MQIRDVWAPTADNPNIQAAAGNKLLGFAVHQTANLKVGANADAHGRLQKNRNVRVASWHATVDEKEAVRSFRKEVRCWHAGTAALHYYAVELCVNADGDYVGTLRNAARYIAKVHVEDGVPLLLKQHHDFTGKHCPTQLRDARSDITWATFKAWVAQEVAALRAGTPATPAAQAPTVSATPAAERRKPIARPVLKRGARGAEVGLWQDVLVANGYSIGAAGRDEDFGPAVEKATRAWQKARGLVDDAVVGPRSWARSCTADKNGRLERGDRGPHVEVWQAIAGVARDRSFGPDTAAGTQAVQRWLGVTPDAVVGTTTTGALVTAWT